MKKVNYPNLNDYDLSAYEELKGDVLYKINGGEKVDNSDAGVAGAKEGDYIIRDNGDKVELKQIDIELAREKLDIDDDTSTSNGAGTTNKTNNNSSSNSGGSTRGGTTTPISGNNSTGGTNVNGGDNTTGRITYDRNDETKIYVNLDDPNSLNAAMDLMADVGLGYKKVVAYSEESGKTREFTSYGEINAHLTKIQGSNSLSVKESDVKNFLIRVAVNSENYEMEAYRRKALFAYKGERCETFTHSLYVITDKTTGEQSTLSFNGLTPIGFLSKGAWGLDTETDVKGFESYIDGENKFEMQLYKNKNQIDVNKTASNIVKSINSDISYMALDHMWNWDKWENCNTGLYNTISIRDHSHLSGSF